MNNETPTKLMLITHVFKDNDYIGIRTTNPKDIGLVFKTSDINITVIYDPKQSSDKVILEDSPGALTLKEKDEIIVNIDGYYYDISNIMRLRLIDYNGNLIYPISLIVSHVKHFTNTTPLIKNEKYHPTCTGGDTTSTDFNYDTSFV